jgi:hypothetical protein
VAIDYDYLSVKVKKIYAIAYIFLLGLERSLDILYQYLEYLIVLRIVQYRYFEAKMVASTGLEPLT